MISKRNILGPKYGKLILSPSQDIILGMYYLTKIDVNQVGSNRVYTSFNDIRNLLSLNKLHVHSLIALHSIALHCIKLHYISSDETVLLRFQV